MKLFLSQKNSAAHSYPNFPLVLTPPPPAPGEGVQSKMAASSSERSIVTTFRKGGDLILSCTLII